MTTKEQARQYKERVNNSESAIPERLRVQRRWKATDGKNPGSGWNIDENLKTYDKACDHARKIGADGVIYIVGKKAIRSRSLTWTIAGTRRRGT